VFEFPIDNERAGIYWAVRHVCGVPDRERVVVRRGAFVGDVTDFEGELRLRVSPVGTGGTAE
jgi:hypothetical protein